MFIAEVYKFCAFVTIITFLGQNADVQIKYVRAHIGHFWNEKADKNARLGSTNDNNKVHIATPTSWAKKKITDSTYKRWSSRWSHGCINLTKRFR